MESNHAPKLTFLFTTLLFKAEIPTSHTFVPFSVAGGKSVLRRMSKMH